MLKCFISLLFVALIGFHCGFCLSLSSEGESPSQGDAELGSVPPIQSPQSGQQSPQSLSTVNVDSGTEYLSDSTTDTLDVTMSLCGTEGYSRKIKKGRESMNTN